MAGDVNSIQALSVLYDLALTVGSEVSLDVLLTRSLQRFLYHTGFPAGFVHSRPTGADADAERDVRIEKAVGSYELVKRRGDWLRLPAPLTLAAPAFLEAPELLAGLPSRKPYRYALRLPIEGFGGMLLLSPHPPTTTLPLAELFMPIMSQLSNAIGVCRRIEDRTAALEQANRELEDFSYSVSHDLRTPLRAIDGYSALVLKREGDRLDDEGKRMLGVVRASTQRMARLIDDILGFTRAGRLELRMSVVDVERLVHDAWADLAPAREGRDVSLAVGLLPSVRADPAMLRQVVTNLLGNAIKFTSRRAAAHVEVTASIAGREASFAVKDDGVGFDPRFEAKLFGVFQRLHAIDEFEGTGIGLAIVKRIVLRHGGRVWAEGAPGQGATFHFALPLGDA